MNREALTQFWDHFRQVNGIALRVIETWPEDKLDSRPIPNMRTPKELVVHAYGVAIKGIAEGVLSGTIGQEPEDAEVAAGIESRDDLLRFARDCWNAGDKAVSQITDKHLQAIVKTPWNFEFPGAVGIMVASDEFLHHRGQMYAFSRALGGEPPMMWDFENNAPEFRPKAQAQA